MLSAIALIFGAAAFSGIAVAAQGLKAMGTGGEVVFDSNNDVYWLAHANFAASPEGQEIQKSMGVMGIAPNGAMTFQTAQKWIAALNAYDHNRGYLGHTDWQLPATPFNDSTCGARGPGGASFGALCQRDALGNLYYAGLGNVYAKGAVPFAGATIGSFRNLQLSYYWTNTSGGVSGMGKQVFSFNSGQADVVEKNDTYYYALAMVPKNAGPIGGTAPDCPAGSQLSPYIQGPAANEAVYDCGTGISWLADANLAASDGGRFGIAGDIPGNLHFNRPYPKRHAVTVVAPKISHGAMLWDTATQWVDALNAFQNGKGYLGSSHWMLPELPADLRTLSSHLNLVPGDRRLMAQRNAGPFRNLQPFFYWEVCMPDPNGPGRTSPDCDAGNAPPGRLGRQLNFDFDFGYGLQSTDLSTLKYFVMVYYPAAGGAK